MRDLDSNFWFLVSGLSDKKLSCKYPRTRKKKIRVQNLYEGAPRQYKCCNVENKANTQKAFRYAYNSKTTQPNNKGVLQDGCKQKDLFFYGQRLHE